MSKSIEQISSSIMRKVSMTIMQELPEPSCKNEKQHWRWRVEQVKKQVATELMPGIIQGMGIKVEV